MGIPSKALWDPEINSKRSVNVLIYCNAYSVMSAVAIKLEEDFERRPLVPPGNPHPHSPRMSSSHTCAQCGLAVGSHGDQSANHDSHGCRLEWIIPVVFVVLIVAAFLYFLFSHDMKDV
uniref:Uncharacterized protein n=1 Tax=Branchiostoma floridae TaxID=7739 RepID=C3Y1L5_BRAFL|eukprot:XP_002609745.1 hypothetical protein BRAFLDRAFT_78573 [Branchiostoma floridae]